MNDKWCAIIFNISAFILMVMPPYSLYYLPIARIILLLIPLALPIINQHKISRNNFNNAVIYFVSWFLIYSVSYIANNRIPETSYFLYTFYGTAFLLMKDTVQLKTFQIFVRVFAAILGLGIIEYIFFMQGLYIPIGITTRAGSIDEYDLIQCFFNFFSLQDGDVVRFQSLAEEPGLIGTLCAFLLFVINSKEYKIAFWIFIIAGILTLSLAFVVLFLFYIAVSVVQNKRSFVIALACVACLFVVMTIFKDTEEVQSFTVRLEKGHDADNRTSHQFDRYLNEMMESSDVWFGKGYGSIKDLYIIDGGNAGAKVLFYQIGIVGVVLLFVVYTYLIFQRKGKNLVSLFFLIAFWASFYQRETISVPYNVIVFFAPLSIRKEYNYLSNENIRNHPSIESRRC